MARRHAFVVAALLALSQRPQASGWPDAGARRRLGGCERRPGRRTGAAAKRFRSLAASTTSERSCCGGRASREPARAQRTICPP